MILLPVLLAGVFGVLFGIVIGLSARTKIEWQNALRQAGISKEALNLYGRAVRIFRRLSGLAALDGELSGDSLSPESRKLITDWLDDYRKLTTKGDPSTVTK